jgi:hypothetical protein
MKFSPPSLITLQWRGALDLLLNSYYSDINKRSQQVLNTAFAGTLDGLEGVSASLAQ